MFKCKFGDALNIATALGFSMPATAVDDAAKHGAVKSFLIDKKPNVNGQVLDFTTVEFEEQPTKSFNLNLTPSTPANGQQTAANTVLVAGTNQPQDWDIKLGAAVAAEIKKLGLGGTPRRPGLIVPKDAPITVKSGEQREYEDRIDRKSAFCKSYDVAKGMHEWMRAKTSAAYLDQGGYSEALKGFSNWADEVGGDGKKAYDTFTSASAGNSVPDLFQSELIRNVLDYGVFSQLARLIQMPGPQMTWTQRTGGVTGSYPAENVAPSQATATLNNITLNAKTFQTLQQASKQILSDSGISMMEWIMAEAAMAIAKQKDDALIIGNASGTYAGATGYEFKYGVTATDGGYVVVGGGTAVAHAYSDLVNLVARLPQNYRQGACFTCSPTIASLVFDRLSIATPGGLTLAEYGKTGYVRTFMGFPIIENNSMSSISDAGATNRTGFTAGDQIDILFGNFSKAAFFGELQGMEVEISGQGGAGMTTNSTYVAVRARFDSNVYNIGTSTAAQAVVSFWQT